jgi:phage terminase small subunit
VPDLKGRMTPQESAFVEAMVRTGDAVYSATVAGYAQPPSAASKALKRPDIVAAIQTAVRLRVQGEGAAVARTVLVEIALDKTAPKAPRVAAARALAEMTHLGGVEGAGLDKPLSEMSRAELVEARQRAIAYLAELDAPVLEAAPLPAPDGGLFD